MSETLAPHPIQAPPDGGLRAEGLVRAGWKRAALAAPLKLLLGMLLTQGLLAVMIIGWSYRLAQRVAWRTWSKQQAGNKSQFSRLAEAHPLFRPHLLWPNWVLAQNFWEAWRDPRRRLGSRQLRALLGSLWLNLKTGLLGLGNTWALTLPCGVLWLFAWHAGWNNSFYKGYEMAWVGPATGLFGICLFGLVMLYVPAAQARQAVTGNWRAFYDFRVVWRILRQSWFSFLLLALLYTLFSVPVMVFKTLPMFFPQMRPEWADASPEAVKRILSTYYFLTALVVFPAFVALRMAAARFYAKAVWRGLRNGSLSWPVLDPNERRVFEALGRAGPAEPPLRPGWWRAAGWMATRGAFAVGLLLTILVWFSFSAQIYISEFLNYHPFIGWLNQPLVQVPFFRYLPPGLGTP